MPGVLDELRREYLAQQPGDNPVKSSITLERTPSGEPLRFVNFMAARLSNGVFGQKTVIVDETAGVMRGDITLYDARGNLLSRAPADFITRLRCGYMTAMAIDLFFEGRRDRHRLKIGFIGAGRINQTIRLVLRDEWGCGDFKVVGSPRAPRRHEADWAAHSDTVDRVEDLDDRDVIVSCTNIFDPAERVSLDRLSRNGAGPRLYIAHDTGWLLDESFRASSDAFADNPAQLDHARASEFFWDKTPPRFVPGDWLGGSEFRGAHRSYDGTFPAVAYLYGIALADLVVAKGYGAKAAVPPKVEYRMVGI
jgi:hypothetical protein